MIPGEGNGDGQFKSAERMRHIPVCEYRMSVSSGSPHGGRRDQGEGACAHGFREETRASSMQQRQAVSVVRPLRFIGGSPPSSAKSGGAEKLMCRWLANGL